MEKQGADFNEIINTLAGRLQKLDLLIDDNYKKILEGDKSGHPQKDLARYSDQYDKIVKRLIEMNQKSALLGDSDDEAGWKKDIISLIKRAREEQEKHTLMIRKVIKSHGISTSKKTSLLADFGRDRNSQTEKGR